jgi:hypothetical protein
MARSKEIDRMPLSYTVTKAIDRIRHSKVCVLAGLGSFAISMLGLAAIASSNAAYLSSPGMNQYPDAIDYLTLAEGIAARGTFSRTGDGRPDILRTPFYPLILAACNAYRHPMMLYVFQCGMLAASVGMVVRTVHAWLGVPSAILVTILLWMEYRLHIMCFQAMSEIASLFFLLSGLAVLGWPAFPIWKKLTWRRSLIAGVLLGTSVMIRPAILYLPLLLSGAALVYYWLHPKLRSRAAFWSLLTLPIAFSVLPAVWVLRNWLTFGVLTFTPVSSHNLIFFAGAGAWQFQYDVERFEAQDMIVQQFNIPSYSVAQNPYSQDRLSIREIEESLQAAQRQILMTHPTSLIASSLIGILKASMDHSLDSLGYLVNRPWKSVGAGELLRLRRTAWYQLWNNDWTLRVGFLLYAIQLVLLWGAIMVGSIKALRNHPRSKELVGVGVILAYGYLIVALFGIDATFRSTIAVMPALYLLAGYALCHSEGSDLTPMRGSDV